MSDLQTSTTTTATSPVVPTITTANETPSITVAPQLEESLKPAPIAPELTNEVPLNNGNEQTEEKDTIKNGNEQKKEEEDTLINGNEQTKEEEPLTNGTEPAAAAAAAPATAPTPVKPPMVPAPKPALDPIVPATNPLPADQVKHLLNSIKAVRKTKDAAPFLVPVDIVKDNIPFYYNYVSKPMDLSTIEKKLNLNAYETVEEVTSDFQLMVNNCCTFNGQQSAFSKMARNIQAIFEKVLTTNLQGRRKADGVPKIRRESAVNDGRPKREIHPPKSKDITYESKPRKKKFIPELRFCSQVLRDLLSKKNQGVSFPFQQPVDVVQDNCPTYYDIIKTPMDLGTIQSKLTNNEYENADEFELDVRLVFQNAYTFNPPSTPVNMMAHKLEEIFDKKWVDKPATPPSPQVLSEYESESEDETEELKIDETMKEIETLEAKIDQMVKQVEILKKDLYDKIKQERTAKRKSKKGGRRSTGTKKRKIRRDSSVSGLITGPITFEMKQELSSKLADLPEEDTEGVVQIIQSMKNPPAPVNEDGEMELELDALDQETITKLYNFVFKKKKKSGPGRPSSGIMKNRREKKLITEDEQNKHIENLKKQLKRFDGGIDSSSDDDDESEESSEEE